MLKKKALKKSNKTSVVFEIAGFGDADSICLVGAFNDWELDKHKLKLRKDGSWATTLRLENNKSYEYRFVVDGTQWQTDQDADELVLNEFGEYNSVVALG
jgi:1,4-alpha-glucan branching enzyme